jgi:hypothetical protein
MVLSATPSECRGFLDLVLGNRDGKGGWHPPADIVVISHTLFNTDMSGRSLPGARIARRLRAHGFVGLVCIMTSDQTSLEIDEAWNHPAVDLVIQSDSLVEVVCARLLQLHMANRRPARRFTHVRAEADLAEAQEAPSDAGQVEAVAQAPNLSGLSRTNSKWDSPMKPPRVSPRSGGQPTTPLSPDGPTAAEQAGAQPTGPLEGQAGETSLEEGPGAAEVKGPNAAGEGVSREAASREGASPVEAPRTLRVCTLDDESIPRMIQTLFIKHHLHASLTESCTLGANEEEMHAFVDVALGKLNADLTPNQATHRQADIVVLDENIQPPQIMGSLVAGELRDRGFAGVIAILTGASASGTEEIRALPAVDLVFDKGHSLSKMAEEVFRVLEQRRTAA